MLLFPLTGYAADRFDRRRFLIITQSAVSARSFAFGLLTVTGIVRLSEVEVFACLFGSVTAFDGPARQTVVSNLIDHSVEPRDAGAGDGAAADRGAGERRSARRW